ncbi:MAG: hypothetical protein ACRDQ7_15870 [Haloechinothrix sp.]
MLLNPGTVSAWMQLASDTSIDYRVAPTCDEIEFEIGHGGLDLVMDGAGLEHCIARFSAALAELREGQGDG